jgi:hypothetical protein
MTHCPQCGSLNDRRDDFCRSCGAPLPRNVQVAPRSAPSAPVATSVKPLISPPAHPGKSAIRPKTVLSPVVIVGFIAIILIIAGAVFFVFSGSPLPVGSQNNTSASRGPGIVPAIGQCSAGLSRCSGTCVDLRTDPDNCGACGFAVPYGETCRNGQFYNPSATAGTTPAGSALTPATAAGIQGSCPSGRTSCSGTCADLQNDARHCGSCGTSCLSGQTCFNGRCYLPGTQAPVVSTNAPVTITPDLSCSSGQIACGGSCVDVFSDKKNCGVCGRACKSLEKCVNAQCGPACTVSGTSLCDDTCVDLNTDMLNCGACGTECKTFLPNAKGSLCSGGKCIISQCNTGYGDCDNNFVNGCEVNLNIDANNCGACGNKCPAGQVCYSKKCSKPIGT